MPNVLHFDESGRETDLFLTLPAESFPSLLAALEYIRDNPKGERIEEVFFPPVFINYYEDDIWKISFGLSLVRTGESETHNEIGITAIHSKR